MTEEELRKKIAYLEMVNDQLTTELSDLDELLRSVGFPHGLVSVKLVAEELLEYEDDAA